MRLLVVSQYFWPESFRINDLVAEFVKRGHEVTVLTGIPNYPEGNVFDAYEERPSDFTCYEGACIVRVPMLPRGQGGMRLILNYLSFAFSATVLGAWKLRGQRFDAIFVYEPSPITVGIPGVVMRAVKRAPMAFWVLDLWPETLKAVGVVRAKWLLWLGGQLVALIYKRCDLILAQSKSFVSQIQKYAGSEPDVKYFPSWAESVFDSRNVIPTAKVPALPGGFTIMFAGNIGEAQDFPAVLAAAEKLKQYTHIRWLILGDGRLASWVAKEIQRRNLSRCVYMLGRYPVGQMPSFFRRADALLVSLKDEPIFAMTIPGKLQAYLAAGVPVIGMLNGEGADLLNSSQAGLACPAGDAKRLADGVLKLAAMDKTEREAMGRRGQELYAREFRRELLMDKLENWLEELAARRLADSKGGG